MHDEFDMCTARQQDDASKSVDRFDPVQYMPFAANGNVASRTERQAVAEINVDMCKQLWIINMMRSTDSDYHLI